MTITEQAEQFLAQACIAIVGVSRNDGAGTGIYRALRDRGYTVVPVNPNIDTFDGQPCYADVQSVPDGVQAAVIATNPAVTETVARDCVAGGVGHVWMHFNPMFGQRTSSVSAEATAYLRQHGVTVIDGACPLMFGEKADFGHKCMRWMLGVTGKLPTAI